MSDTEAIWAAKTDDELLEAAAELSEYTEEGERVIRAELARRGLPPPEPPIGACGRCGRSIARNHPRDECSQCGEVLPPEVLRVLNAQAPEAEADTALVQVLRTGDAGLTLLAKSLFEREGIEYFVRGENLQDLFGVGRLGGYNYITGPAEFWVRMPDAERARAVVKELTAPPQESTPDSKDA